MKIRAQIGMVLNLDKCIGCHTCSVTCKNVWTSRQGVEYAWFNNVETKPGVGYPRDWENQARWNGGWTLSGKSKIKPKMGGKFRLLAKIFANPGFTGNRRLLRTLHLRLPAPAKRTGIANDTDRTHEFCHHRRAYGKTALGAELGRDSRR